MSCNFCIPKKSKLMQAQSPDIIIKDLEVIPAIDMESLSNNADLDKISVSSPILNIFKISDLQMEPPVNNIVIQKEAESQEEPQVFDSKEVVMTREFVLEESVSVKPL
ncbi:Hypothetical_protein [Hexamita inflata]|uniref:Hypothetical_protein n=1 Tax=Hexamita inflata TaxID=28002 RepID=A0AA86QVH7_9EUKA|nr:Hypothetical protein HINF_LOCUS49207 [Hexamita inflata]